MPEITERPKLIDTGLLVGPCPVDDALYRCEVCGNIDTWDDYDCGGADEDCVFCNNCGTELQT